MGALIFLCVLNRNSEIIRIQQRAQTAAAVVGTGVISAP